MRRRRFISACGIAAATGLAGCLGGDGGEGGDGGNGGNGGDGGDGDGFDTRRAGIPPVVEDRPDAVYVPSHFETMSMVGRQESAGQTLALSFTTPHRFWTMETEGTQRVSIGANDSVHMMASVWHTDAGVYVTDAAPTLEVSKDGETVVENNSPWAMLSQPMGFHFGDNLQLDGEGTYQVTIETSAPTTRRTGSLEGVGGRGTFEFEMEFSRSRIQEIVVNTFPNRQGSRDAVAPMNMEMLPLAYAPEESALPGTVLGSGTSGDARFVVTELSDAARFGGSEDQTYIAVSPRTPYNRFIIPQMALDLRVGDREPVPLTPTLDPDLDFHYGAAVDPPGSGQDVTVEPVSPPNLARHEGYETAFLELSSVTLTA